MENFSTQWFTAYYLSLGALLLSYGIYLMFKTESIRQFLVDAAADEQPPKVWRTVLKYLLLFTIPGLVLSFFPLSWIELIFSLWSLFIIFMAGQLLLLWPQTSRAIIKAGDELLKKIRYVAANMIIIGIVLFMLCYLLLERTTSI
ncbi:MAG: hypothetical protein EA359_04035 [Balneolaceae bacterium]|nr:MAG: hypothetical protein EA359_04035 [Balneolaceae bacterium]